MMALLQRVAGGGKIPSRVLNTDSLSSRVHIGVDVIYSLDVGISYCSSLASSYLSPTLSKSSLKPKATCGHMFSLRTRPVVDGSALRRHRLKCSSSLVCIHPGGGRGRVTQCKVCCPLGLLIRRRASSLSQFCMLGWWRGVIHRLEELQKPFRTSEA